MWNVGNQSKSSLSSEVGFWKLCKDNVRSIEDFTDGGSHLLNQRQCQDMSIKLSKITLNIREILHFAPVTDPFQPALKNLVRHLEKAKVLASKCGEEDWCTAAVFQSQNENAFREILLDVGLCYNAIYELAKNTTNNPNIALLEDLRNTYAFRPAPNSDILQDQEDLVKRLEDLANEPQSVTLLDHFLPGKDSALKQCLARYLLVKLNFAGKRYEASTLDHCSEILWTRKSEPPGTWGNYSRFLGAGSGASGVCNTKWMGIPCAKKEFHPNDVEMFFLKEAGILAYLNHPCIVNFFCCGNGVEKGDRFIAMELMEKSLLDVIEEQEGQRFSLPVVVDMMVQMARGMCYLHGRGVAHRDLKPSNVVVNRLGVDQFCLKLVDFGMSKTKVEVSKSTTMTGGGIGTTIYRAPEAHPDAFRGGEVKVNWFKADVFSFAMTCAHLLSLKTPFKSMSQFRELHKEVLNGHRPRLPDHCPRELIILLGECWDKNSSVRPSFIEISTRLEIFRQNFLKGCFTPDQSLQELDLNADFAFIKAMVKEQFTVQDLSMDDTNDEVEGETYDLNELKKNDMVPTILCTCGHSLQLLPHAPYRHHIYDCDICRTRTGGEVYHCENCQFDGHRDCVEIKDDLNVFFHAHPLHLLVQYYYDNNPQITCDFCGESLQGSEWAYNCKPCNFNVHALCTKHPQKMKMFHSHVITLVQSPIHRNTLCKFCNGKLKGYHYTCTQRQCSYDFHPLCTILSWTAPNCVFDSSHRLSILNHQCSFHCSRCGAPGFSGHYHCKNCDVDLHLDCANDLEAEGSDFNGAYEQFVLEYENTADQKKLDMISEVLDTLLHSSGLETISSSSRPRPVMVQRPTSSERKISSVLDDVHLQAEMIAADGEKRIKAKKMAITKARQKVKAGLIADQGAKLENLKRILQDLQTSSFDSSLLAGTYKKLKKLQDFVQGMITSKMRQVPRICLIYDWYTEGNRNQVLTGLSAVMRRVSLVLLCEEPGHEHIVRFQGYIKGVCIVMDREQMEKIQPMVASGFQVVRAALSRATDITDLGCVTLPANLGPSYWDLQAIDQVWEQQYDVQGKMPDEDDSENVEVQQTAEETAAEWLRTYLEDNEINIFDDFGLIRIRYTATDEQGDCPRYKRGSVAWLCSEHHDQGLEAGILENNCLRIYYNLEYDKHRGFL